MTKAEFLIGITWWMAIWMAGTMADAQLPVGNYLPASASAARSDTIRISLARSTVQWKGTKMRGAGKHEGVVQLQHAFLLHRGGQLIGGRFVLDMRTIRVTDIPAHEPIPLMNLTNHLKGPDFFAVDHYPTARFVITGIKHMESGTLRVAGTLTMKGVIRNITFMALEAGKTVSTTFFLDRFRWNIAYHGSWADKRLVDKDIELTIKLQLL